jgi:ATP-binding cassette, subfamily F, member 3
MIHPLTLSPPLDRANIPYMLIAANQITKFFGQQDLVHKANIHIHFGEKVGLVGPNGSGKSTLLRMLLGDVAPDAGEIHRARHVRIGYLPQDILSVRGRTVMEQVLEVAEEARALEREMREVEGELAVAPENEKEDLAARLAQLLEQYHMLGGYELRPRAEKILMGLGFEIQDFERMVDTLSGGWIMRVALARLLLSDPDLLLLDEPTNHLDLEALRWLEQYLGQVPSAVLVISHDRAFLNRVVNRIVEIADGEIVTYTGDFDAYRAEKARREEHRWAAYRAQQEQIRQVERFVDRNRVRKDRARQAQSRLKALEKIERIEPPRRTEDLRFRFPQAPPSGRIVAELERVSHGYSGKPLYTEASLVLQRGDRVAILGPNGSGKSTLLKILAGDLTPLRGTRRLGHGVKLAYFAQHQMDQLHPDKTVLEEVGDVAVHPHQGELRDLLGAFQFRGDHVFKRVRVLSGGERSRLLLCKILLLGANLLLLDEPTNHLDIGSREVLENAMKEFSGTLCLVTHDRRLMDAVATHILSMRPGGWELFPGTYDDYERVWAKRPSSHTPLPDPKFERVPKRDREQKRSEAEWRNRFFRLRAPIESSIAEIEGRVEETTRRLEDIETEMANPELYRSPERVKALRVEHADLKSDIGRWTHQWEEWHLQLEELEDRMTRERPD